MSSEAELKACPFCGDSEHLDVAIGEVWGRLVYCETCECEGPVAASEEEARELWNARAELKVS